MIGQVFFLRMHLPLHEKNPMNPFLGSSPKKLIKPTKTQQKKTETRKILLKDESKPTNKYIYTYIYYRWNTFGVNVLLFILLLLRFFTVFLLPYVYTILCSFRQSWFGVFIIYFVRSWFQQWGPMDFFFRKDVDDAVLSWTPLRSASLGRI